MTFWFGENTHTWQHLKTYRIRYALPAQERVRHNLSPQQGKLRDGLFAAGDYQLNGSINAAMRAGRQVAEMVAATLVLF
jgi:predicted NAD/FAD-dependent oxidoreductase